jgi:predicted esterase
MQDATTAGMTRRRFGTRTAAALAGVLAGQACATNDAQATQAGNEARLRARPKTGVAASLKSGPIGLGDSERDGLIQVPSRLTAGPAPVLLLLHGATQGAARILSRIGPAADQAGLVVVVPDSRGRTWDAIRDDFGVDVQFIDRVLEHVFARLPVDPRRLAIGGFSDGASYALSLGLANGDLFPSVVAFSPGFVIGAPAQGRPRFYVSHGTNDQILPIDRCSRVIVPRLRSGGYDVTFREFEGRHEVPPDVAIEGFRWMLA